jgi:hypothetical protein
MDGGSDLHLRDNGAAAVLGEMRENADPNTPLPLEVNCTIAFVRRIPTQRLLDTLARIDPTPFGELQDQKPSQVLAFRWLVREFPARDATSLWMHAYDVEIALEDTDPTLALGQMPSLPSAPTTE